MSESKPRFFATAQKFHDWLAKNHDSKTELWVGFYKKASKRPSIDWPESVDQALCFGWIDGIRKSIDDESYKIRFTPRRKNSIWSAVNIRRINELIKLGLVHPSGMNALENRTEKDSIRYAYEQGKVELDKKYLEKIRADQDAWEYFEGLAPSYKKQTIWWIVSAKKPETQLRRLEVLIGCCQRGEKIPPLQVTSRKKK